GLRRTVDHLVAIGADEYRPGMVRTAENHQGAHLSVRARRPHSCGNANPCRPSMMGHSSGREDMNSFETREKEFEARFKHDQELQFKITARRNRRLGLWAAQQLGLLGDAAEAYAQRVVETQLQPGGNRNVVDKLSADLGAKDPT